VAEGAVGRANPERLMLPPRAFIRSAKVVPVEDPLGALVPRRLLEMLLRLSRLIPDKRLGLDKVVLTLNVGVVCISEFELFVLLLIFEDEEEGDGAETEMVTGVLRACEVTDVTCGDGVSIALGNGRPKMSPVDVVAKSYNINIKYQ